MSRRCQQSRERARLHPAKDLPCTSPTPSARTRPSAIAPATKGPRRGRIAASRRERVPGIRGSSRLIVSGIVVALGATSFVVASAADIEIAPTLCSSSSSTIRGTAGNDVLVGTSRNDIIWGGGGDDVISGLQGNDRLCGVDGNDRLYGGSGDDYLDGGVGTDILRGDSGTRDTCLNGEQRAGCELVGTTTPPPTTTTANHRPGHDGPDDDHHPTDHHPAHGSLQHPARRSHAAERAAVRNGRAPDVGEPAREHDVQRDQRHDCEHRLPPRDRQLHRDH